MADSSSNECVQASQWVDEVREKAPQLRVGLYYGPRRDREFSPPLLACYDVVVTTYYVAANECAASPRGALFRVRWHRCASTNLHQITQQQMS